MVDERIVGASEVVRDARVSPIVASPAAVSTSLRKTERKLTKATPCPDPGRVREGRCEKAF